MRIWDSDTSAEVQQINAHEAIVNAVAVSPDGQFEDTNARLWDWQVGMLVGQRQEHTAMVTSVTFSPDGAYLLTASGDGSVRQWHIQSNEPPVQLWYGKVPIYDVSYSPDQRYMAVASDDGIIHIGYVAFADALNLAQARAQRKMTEAEQQTYLRSP